MLLYPHESAEFEQAGNRQGDAISSDKAGPGREGRHEGRRSIAGFGGPETGICNQCTRVSPNTVHLTITTVLGLFVAYGFGLGRDRMG